MIVLRMIEKLQSLERTARLLETNKDIRDNWNASVYHYTNEFLEDLSSKKSFDEFAGKGEGLLDYPFQDNGREMSELLHLVEQEVDQPGLNPASAGHLAYIPGGGVYPTALGDYLADVTNRYAGIYFASPGAVRMENMLIRWMCRLVGFPDTALGNLTSGGSVANLIAVATARDYQGVRARDIENQVIYLTEQVHHSIQKAIRIAGMGEAHFRYIPVDEHYRMNVAALSQAVTKDKAEGLQPFLLIASAGTTDTGAIDPMTELAKIAQANQMWFHVDAAYGGFFLLADEVKAAFKGIEQADSVTIDPHKGLFLAYGTGAVLIKNVEALQTTHNYTASYMQDVIQEDAEPSPANLSPELTKPFRGMRMWLPLQLFGIKPFRAALSEKIWLCRYFYDEVQKLGFEVGPYPELSVMVYRYIPKHGDINEFNNQIVKRIRANGKVFLSSTTIAGVFWLRLAVLCFRTHLETVNACLEELRTTVGELEAGVNT